MNFAEVRSWQLLFLGLACLVVLRALWARTGTLPAWYDKTALLSLGLFLLGSVSWVTLLIFLVIAMGTYIGLWWILQQEPRRRRPYLFVLIPLQLLPLVYYKYANFAVNQVLMFNVDVFRHLVLPVGISFYTFQMVGFVVDTLRFNQPLPRFLDHMNFVAFFPQVLAGPIARRQDLLPQMEQFRFRWMPNCIDEGVRWIVLGLFFKCALAENFALHLDARSQDNAYLIWLANLTFGLRIYYDFAGYSLMALGVARCFGINLALNFASPYCSRNATEFWRRWHITLCQWFRDYLYIPLGGNRVPWWAANVMIVFIVSGIWHGAGWNFILWGALHGAFLLVSRKTEGLIKMPGFLAWLVTLCGTSFAWLGFYESRPAALFAKLQTLFTPAAYGAPAWQGLVAHLQTSDSLVFACLLTLAAIVLILEWRSLAARNEPYALLLQPKVSALLIILTIILSPGEHNDFIYFGF